MGWTPSGWVALDTECVTPMSFHGHVRPARQVGRESAWARWRFQTRVGTMPPPPNPGPNPGPNPATNQIFLNLGVAYLFGVRRWR